MPGGGHQALRSIVETDPAATVIVLTASEDSDLFDAEGRAKGYILKGVNASTLVSAIHNVVAGESYVSPSLAARILTEMRARPPCHSPPPRAIRTTTRWPC